MRTITSGLAALAICLAAGRTATTADETKPDDLLRQINVSRGICVLLGDRQCRVARKWAVASELTVYVQLPGADEVQAARQAADGAGLYGTRIFVERGTPARIGLADNLADAVVAVGDAAGVVKAEVLRVLRPEGKAMVGSEQWVKPFPQGVDEWSHHYHGPDNNPQSQDKLARAPLMTQFVVAPRYAPAPQAGVASAGRVFMAFGNVAWHQREEPMLDTLVAVNGFNGTMLWKRPLRSGIMVDRSTMIATPTVLYLADDTSCKVLDAATGKQVDEIAIPADVAGGTFWKWMALKDGVLYALIGADEGSDPVARWRMVNHGWPWDRISKGYNDAGLLWGQAKTLLAIDPKTKKILWKHQEDPAIDSRALCMNSTRTYLCSFGKYLACLESASGKVLWRKTAEKDPEVFQAIGPYRPGQGYVGGWKTTVYLKCTDKALYFVGPEVQWLTALSAEDGRVLWKHAAMDLQIVLRDDGLYTIGPQNGQNAAQKLDPLTGAVLATFATRRRACTRATGSADGIFFRAHEGSGRLDTATGKMQWISPMRPSCHVGVLVANGYLYWLPWACDCDLQMFGAIGMGPAGNFAFGQQATDAERLEYTAGQSPGSASLKTAAGDWPTYRADSARSARTPATVPVAVKRLWQFAPAAKVEPTAPVAAGGLVFAGGSDGIVRALDAATGQVRWTAYTGGAVYYPPTIADGRALVGSADGWAYAFDAASGKLLWRFRAAPAERRISLYGALASTWPVAGGVLVDRGVAYFAAGMNDLDGTHVYAVDAATGKLRWQNNTCGHLDAASSRGVACQGEMLLSEGRLYLAGGNAVSPGIFDAANGKCLNSPPTSMGTTAVRGRELRVMLGRVIVGGQPLYSLPELPVYDNGLKSPEPAVTAANVTLTFLNDKQDKTDKPPAAPAWVLVATGNNGRRLWAAPLPAEPVRWGLAVDAGGRILVSLRGGQVLGFGEK